MKSFGRYIIAIAALYLINLPVFPQAGYYFGQNKVRYKSFNWKVIKTEHFDVHYYTEMDVAAHDAARMAERGYAYLSEVLDHQFKERIPIILYASLNDFAQTNVVSGLLDQGTRGVTESLKKRVTLPMTGSYREFNHVLVHELVHAFQYDIIFNSPLGINRFNAPLWFIEGMAEYLSNEMDNTTRMWVRDGFIYNNLLSIDKLSSTYDIRVYRLGQSVWHYIGENYGKKTVGKLFKMAARTGNIEMAFKTYLNMDNKQLTKAWHEFARRLAVPADTTLPMPDESATRLTHKAAFYHRMNIAPSVSPDGSAIAYIANKDLNEDIYILRKMTDGHYKNQRLITGGKSKQYETLRYFDTAISWSPDGKKLTFISKSGKDDVIYIVDSENGKLLKEYAFSDLNGLLSPVFSPDGQQLAFVGMQGGISDLYLLNLSDSSRKRLTHDKYAELHPAWGPDSLLAFSTDRGSDTDSTRLLFSDFNIAVINVLDRNIRVIAELPGNDINPQWMPDGNTLYFVSDYEGIPNLYQIALNERQIERLTSLKSGIAGITETTPAFSISKDGKTLVFSSFVNTGWQLYQLSPSQLQPQQPLSPDSIILAAKRNYHITSPIEGLIDSIQTDTSGKVIHKPDIPKSVNIANRYVIAGWLPTLPNINWLYAAYPLPDSSTLKEDKYRSHFSLDAVQLGGGYNTFYGVQGGAAFLFTDMLGNHQLYFATQMQFSDPRYSDFALTYQNQKHRWQWGIQAFQSNVNYLVGQNLFQDVLIRDTYRGVSGIVAYPFSRFTRAEFSGGFTWIEEDLVIESYHSGSIKRETNDLATFNYGIISGALVTDNTTYAYFGPANGHRGRFSVEFTSNDIQSSIAMLDYRKYFRTSSRSVLAWRIIGVKSFGKDERFFDIGGPYLYRGSDYNELVGSNALLSNLEWRIPLLPFLPPSTDFLSAALFWDAAGAWGLTTTSSDRATFQPFSSDGGFHLKDLHTAFGIAARFNAGYFLLQYEVVWPTDLKRFEPTITRFSIGSFF
jgi:Tol biopolymer transport system component